MSFPKFHETFIPILETLSDGKSMHYSDLLDRVLNKHYCHLPEDFLGRKTKAGGSLLLNRISWGKSYLKQGGYVDYPDRGMVQITSRGLETLSNGVLTLKQLKSTPEFLSYRKKKETIKGNP